MGEAATATVPASKDGSSGPVAAVELGGVLRLPMDSAFERLICSQGTPSGYGKG